MLSSPGWAMPRDSSSVHHDLDAEAVRSYSRSLRCSAKSARFFARVCPFQGWRPGYRRLGPVGAGGSDRLQRRWASQGGRMPGNPAPSPERSRVCLRFRAEGAPESPVSLRLSDRFLLRFLSGAALPPVTRSCAVELGAFLFGNFPGRDLLRRLPCLRSEANLPLAFSGLLDWPPRSCGPSPGPRGIRLTRFRGSDFT